MKRWALAVGAGATVLGTAIAWWWFVRCEQECARADHNAQLLFDRGEYLLMLSLIEAVDARCRCERFTQGDVPAQYALAQAALERFLQEGRRPAVERMLRHTRSPILRELAAQLDDAPQS